MSCVEVSAAMGELLELLSHWPEVDLEQMRDRHEFVDAVRWGWAMASGELTGTGLRHLHELPRGILSD